jgi:hypothetical protein
MQYLLLVYTDEKKFGALTPAEHEVVDRESIAYDEDLERSGHYLNSNALQPPEAAITVRVRDGKVSTTDGPFAETKEHLGGYILIEARDMNEAVQIAAKTPMVRFGCIEVRPIFHFKPEE